MLPAEAAVRTLADSVDSRGGDEGLKSRLAAVQEALASELAWVEEALRSSASQGPDPGRAAAQHLVQRGGKRVRPMALLLSSACFGEIPEPARHLAVVVELVHSATLLHDDVIDEGNERRGAPAARKLWGNAVSILAGDLALVHALGRTSDAAPDLLPSLVATLRSLVDGEIIQLRGRSALDVTEATYQRILELKTASLFGWATRSGARVAGASDADCERMAKFGELLGVAFQLVDDAIDYAGEGTGKTLFADLREGKVTLPLVLAVERVPALAELVRRIHGGGRRRARGRQPEGRGKRRMRRGSPSRGRVHR